MKKTKSFLYCMAILLISLLPMISYGAAQTNYNGTKATWVGGVMGGNSNKAEGKNLAEISIIADQQSALFGLPVEYKTEDGKMIYQAYPDYGKSKCRFVYNKAWLDGKLIMSKANEVCSRNYQGIEPYGEILNSLPQVPRIK